MGLGFVVCIVASQIKRKRKKWKRIKKNEYEKD
jgi:hypothetical protein